MSHRFKALQDRYLECVKALRVNTFCLCWKHRIAPVLQLSCCWRDPLLAPCKSLHCHQCPPPCTLLSYCPPHRSLTVSDKCSWICCCPSQSFYPSQNTPLSQSVSPAQSSHPSLSTSTAGTIQILPSQCVYLIPVYLHDTVNKLSITESTSITEQSSITVYIPQRVHHYGASITESIFYGHLRSSLYSIYLSYRE